MSLEGVFIINRRSKSTSKAKAFGARGHTSTKVAVPSGTSYAYFSYQVAIEVSLAVTYVLITNSIWAAGVGIARGCQDFTNPIWY